MAPEATGTAHQGHRLRPSPPRSVAVRLGERWREGADPRWLEGWEARPFELPGGVTEVVVMGQGPPLLLLPPLPGFKEAWVACAGPLARAFRIVTFDLRTRFAGRPPWEALLEDLERVAEAFAPGAAAVVGHSLGGALAQRWALARPERVRALVLSSSFARLIAVPGQWGKRYLEQPAVLAGQRWLPAPLAGRLARRLAARGAWVYDPRCDGRVLALVRHAIRATSLALASQRVRLAIGHDTRGGLPSLACPTLVLVGEREARYATEAAAELTRLIPHAEARVSPGAGHLHPLSNAGWFADTVTEWTRTKLHQTG